MEKWDLYDKNRNKLNKILERGSTLSDDEYHLVVNGWVKNDKDEFLITQRAPHKSFPYMWECTGGSALSGETSLQAVAREVKEELNIDIDLKKATLFNSTLRYYKGCPDILDVWVIIDNTPIEQVKVQEEEVMDVMWASREKIMELYKDGKFEANAFFEDVIKNG